MTDRYDVIVVGGGHNGMVCAALLARSGKQVLLLEANERLGGAAVTREFADGFSVSACAHLLYQLHPQICKDLQLELELAATDITTIALHNGFEHVRLRGNEVSGALDGDEESYQAFRKRMLRFAELLQTFFEITPPRLGSGEWSDLATLARMGLNVRRLGKTEMREFLRLVGMNIRDEVVERFRCPVLRAAVCFDAVLGTHLGPRSPNTVLTYLYRLAADKGRISLPVGGMGSVTAALAQAARASGVDVRTGTPVQRILVENGRTTGVETTDGKRFDSLTVVSNTDPKRTMLELVGAQHLEAGFAHRFQHLRCNGNAAKLHLALDGLPKIEGLDDDEYGARIVLALDEDYVERAFNPAKYGESSPEPVMEITFPTVHDRRLAPPGMHVLSAVVQYAPYRLKAGWDDAARQGLESAAIRAIEAFSPDITSHIVASELLTPQDIEREFRIAGGHWHHGELALDQFLFVRPVAGAAQYRMPVDGLFLCGAGTHPGGGVSGLPGRNAAREILRRNNSA